MYFASLSSVAFATFIFSSVASAGCFNGGQSWGDKELAKKAVKAFCSNFSSLSYSRELLDAGTSKSGCLDGPAGTRFDFTVEKIVDDLIFLDEPTCVEFLTNEVHGCDHGGSSRVRYWWFTLTLVAPTRMRELASAAKDYEIGKYDADGRRFLV
ncbi:uncharacterized protein K452DRAFT_312645 [Aplosporella prunicola CBS 121167]|uniref:Ecp2 effector protein domain-containing protein n=1 Tax=Aplosporella prunicola CBS 121167 TaxID=1176127 RepID=A0A6A6AYS6_9PEZI|nr:uncharacterized protein K452DRAFT_312645 [Aplosporella prunicola CBS 121167]KAF2137082.1 hypothetical protein K452DRAFT_312645 [Aplosporella prunicola CBS 121167]